MTAKPTAAEARATTLSRRAVVVSDDAIAAARCASAFDDVQVVPTSELDTVLPGLDLSRRCVVLVAVTGANGVGGPLARLLAQSPAPEEIVVVLDDESGQ